MAILASDSAGGSKPEQCASLGTPRNEGASRVRCGSKPEQQCASPGKARHSNQISVRFCCRRTCLSASLSPFVCSFAERRQFSKPVCLGQEQRHPLSQLNVPAGTPYRGSAAGKMQRGGNSRVRLSWWVEARTMCFAGDTSPFQSNQCPSLSSSSSSYHHSPLPAPTLINRQPGFKSIWTGGERERGEEVRPGWYRRMRRMWSVPILGLLDLLIRC